MIDDIFFMALDCFIGDRLLIIGWNLDLLRRVRGFLYSLRGVFIFLDIDRVSWSLSNGRDLLSRLVFMLWCLGFKWLSIVSIRY